MYNIPVLKTLNRGQSHSEIKDKNTETNQHRELVVSDMQDVVQILQHNTTKQISKKTQLFTTEYTLDTCLKTRSKSLQDADTPDDACELHQSEKKSSIIYTLYITIFYNCTKALRRVTIRTKRPAATVRPRCAGCFLFCFFFLFWWTHQNQGMLASANRKDVKRQNKRGRPLSPNRLRRADTKPIKVLFWKVERLYNDLSE